MGMPWSQRYDLVTQEQVTTQPDDEQLRCDVQGCDNVISIRDYVKLPSDCRVCWSCYETALDRGPVRELADVQSVVNELAALRQARKDFVLWARGLEKNYDLTAGVVIHEAVFSLRYYAEEVFSKDATTLTAEEEEFFLRTHIEEMEKRGWEAASVKGTTGRDTKRLLVKYNDLRTQEVWRERYV